MDTMTILDGRRLAAERAPGLRTRADAVRQRRGRAPSFLLLTFGDDGAAPHVRGKLRAADLAGIDAVPLVLPVHTTTQQAIETMHARTDELQPDGLFQQFPYPPHIDFDALAHEIPAALDVDVMGPHTVQHYLDDEHALPPVTVSAALALLQRYDVDIDGADGAVVADASPFADMFRLALARRGAVMRPLLAPDAASQATTAHLAVIAAARPALLPASAFQAGTIVIDAGYYNEGGRGDVLPDRTDHLRAFSPVPGGIGPMTVSCLMERVLLFAEKR